MNRREPFDLLARARRQPLLASEEAELSTLLHEDVAARALLEAGLQADRDSVARSSDAAWITRMARSVELAGLNEGSKAEQHEPRRLARRSLGRTLRSAPVLAAAICFACGAAAGVSALTIYSAVAPAPTLIATTAPRASSRLAQRPSTNGVVAPAVSSTPLAAPLVASAALPPAAARTIEKPRAAAALAPSTPAPEASVETTPAAPAQEKLTSSELYRRANRARQEGRSAEATATYLELQARYPSSPEAVASHLTLGNLYLLQDRAELSLEQFRAHLAAGGGGFERESLWGASLSLRKLGRLAEERAMLSELVTRFPNSAYELSARRRLQTED